jgi:3-methyladenine DNA glycosylase AlkD
MRADQVISSLREKSSKSMAQQAQRFFKTGKGEYGYGDIFLGVRVPQIREIAKKHKTLTLKEIEKLTASKFHEVRLSGLVILTQQYKAPRDEEERKKIFDFYLKQLIAGRINNWDLIDVTAPIIGQYLIGKSSSITLLKRLAQSESLWRRRAAILFTFAYLRVGEIAPTITIAKLLIKDEQDLMHKAVGWSLREVGKVDLWALRNFLSKNVNLMSRTTLRYAIEKLPKSERANWLNK